MRSPAVDHANDAQECFAVTAVLVCMALALALTGWWLLREAPVEAIQGEPRLVPLPLVEP